MPTASAIQCETAADPHNIPDYRWQSIATDLVDTDGQTFLLTVDPSKYPLVDHMLVTCEQSSNNCKNKSILCTILVNQM